MSTVLQIIAWCIFVVALLYLLMIMPRVLGKPDTKEFKKWLYAHRGLHNNESEAPENSLKAFGKAVKAGFGIELDVQLTKDGIPVVFHDDTLKRVCGVDGKISDFTYEELQQFTLFQSQEKIPKLEQVLKLVNGKVPLIVELKVNLGDLSLCPVVDGMLREYKGLYCIESFNPLVVLWYHLNHNSVVRGQLSDMFSKEGDYSGPAQFALQNLLLNFLSRPDFVAYNHKYPNVLSRKICHGLYRNTAAAWTIKSEEELLRARKHFDLFIFDDFIPQEKC